MKTNKEKIIKNKKIIKKKKLKSWVYILMLLLFLIIFSFSTYKIIKWAVDSHNRKVLTKSINDLAPVTEVTDEGTLINPPENKSDDYWDFIKIPYISVDFNKLKEKNPDTIAWINIANSNINYPVVQTTDNNFYLTHSFQKNWSGGGWIYMDYRNSSTNFDANTVIYGHSMKDKSMFGTLLNARYEWWYTNPDNQVIRISTPTENTLWRLFSTYSIDAENYYITTSFATDEAKQEFFNTIKARSKHDFGVDLTATDKILTLSTCNSATTDERLVLHAKLISIETR